MDDKLRTTLAQELIDLSRKLATTWHAQLSLARRRPDLAAPLLTHTARSGQRFRAFCRRLAEYVQVDRRGRIRPSYLGRKALAGAAVGAAISLALGVTGAQAADIHVNAGVGDPGCDLIDAILSANTDTGDGRLYGRQRPRHHPSQRHRPVLSAPPTATGVRRT